MMAFSPLFQGYNVPIRRCSQCIRHGYGYLRTTPPPHQRASSIRHLTTSTRRSATTKNPLRSSTSSDHAQAREAELARYRRQIGLSAAGIVACAVAMYGVIELDVFGAGAASTTTDNTKAKTDAEPDPSLVSFGTTNKRGTMQLDGPAGFPSGPSVIRIQGQEAGVEQVETGNSAVPFFPSTIRLPTIFDEARSETSTLKQPGHEVSVDASSEDTEEYQLLGLGLRTVSFLGIEVYVVGLYVAKSDIAKLHQRLIQTAVNPPTPPKAQGQQQQEDGTVSPIVGISTGTTPTTSSGAPAATSLVPAEREALKNLLLDPTTGEEAWNAILKVDRDNNKVDGIRTVFRIVPTRNTDFLHLRDGWVRGITARAQKAIATARSAGTAKSEFEDEAFGSAMNEFKAVFGGGQRKSVPKGQTLMLLRNGAGALDALFQAAPDQPIRWLGRVEDERVGRLVWMNYLAGKTVSSESARRSVVDGMMAIVERPVGTVVQKVI